MPKGHDVVRHNVAAVGRLPHLPLVIGAEVPHVVVVDHRRDLDDANVEFAHVESERAVGGFLRARLQPIPEVVERVE